MTAKIEMLGEKMWALTVKGTIPDAYMPFAATYRSLVKKQELYQEKPTYQLQQKIWDLEEELIDMYWGPPFFGGSVPLLPERKSKYSKF